MAVRLPGFRRRQGRDGYIDMSRRHGPRSLPRERRALTLVVAAVCAVGCGRGESRAILTALGVVDVAPPSAERVALLCDNSAGSTCSAEALARVIQAALLHLAERPGSRIALYVLGGALADTRLVWAESISTPAGLRPRDIEASRKAQLEQVRTALLEKAQPYLGRGPLYQALLGTKLLLVLHVFVVGLLMVKPKNPKRARQITGIAISGVIIIAMSAVLRQLHLH